MSVRRRGLIGAQQHEVIPPLEYSDAYMVVFDCDAGVGKTITYNSKRINRYVLDGIEYNPSPAVYIITPPTSGTHTLYFWLNSSTRLANNFSAKYLRIPETPFGWNNSFMYHSVIDQIDCLSKTPYNISADFSGVFKKIRVPVGSGDAYKNHQYWGKWKNIIEETNNFNYTI